MSFRKVSITSRIAGSILALLLFVFGLTFLSLSQMRTLERNLERVVEVNNLRSRLSHQMSESTHIVTRVIRTIMLLNNRSMGEIEYQKIVKARADYDVAWRALQKIPMDEQGEALRAQISAANDALRAPNDEMIALGLAGRHEQGRALLMSRIIPLTEKLQALINANLGMIEVDNQHKLAAVTREFKNAKYLLIAFNSLLLAVAATLGWALARFISELKRSKAALKVAASVFKHTQEAILITNERGNIIDVNGSFATMTGYSRAEVLGKNPRLLKSAKQDEAFFMGMFDDLSATGEWTGEKWNRHKDGQNYLVLATITAVRDEKKQIEN